MEFSHVLKNGNKVTVTVAEDGAVAVSGSHKVNVCIPFAKRGGEMKAFAKSPEGWVDIGFQVETECPSGPVVVTIGNQDPIRVPFELDPTIVVQK